MICQKIEENQEILSKIFYKKNHVFNGIDTKLLPIELPELDVKYYGSNNSLFVIYESDELVEFQNFKPFKIYRYIIMITLGSSNCLSEPIGTIGESSDRINFNSCYFYTDFFSSHPKKLSESRKLDPELINAKTIFEFADNEIIYSKIPTNSIISRLKICKQVDINDKNDIDKIEKFMLRELEKIRVYQNKIKEIEEKINNVITTLNIEKNIYQNNIDKILSDKGNNLDDFIITLNDILTKKKCYVY